MISHMKLRGEILPYERLLIPSYNEIVAEMTEALCDSGCLLNKELNFIGGIEQSKQSSDQPMDAAEETLLRYKANEREQKREKRVALLEKERE